MILRLHVLRGVHVVKKEKGRRLLLVLASTKVNKRDDRETLSLQHSFKTRTNRQPRFEKKYRAWLVWNAPIA